MGALQQVLLSGRRISVTVPVSATFNYIATKTSIPGYVAGITDVTFTIASGVTIGSTNANLSSPAFDVSANWDAGDTVTIINNGNIYGAPGPGGNGGGGSSANGNDIPPQAGTQGGTALRALRPCTVTNNGNLYGGGGGGGGGGSACTFGGATYTTIAGGGGGTGAGAFSLSGGAGGAVNGTVTGSAAGAGNTTTGGIGGNPAVGDTPSGTFGGKGGNGGGWGTAGSKGITGASLTDTFYDGAVGGAAGRAIDGKAFVNGGAGVSIGALGTQV